MQVPNQATCVYTVTAIDPAGTDVVDLKITIDEGSQFKVGSIKFDGKADIPGTQLTEMTALHEGDIFTQQRLDETIVQLNSLGSGLRQDTNIDISIDDKDGLVNVVVFLNKNRPAMDPSKRH